MDVHYSDELKQAFVVSPADLKKLVELLQKRIGKVSISTDCIDKIQREFTTVKDLIDYENPKSKRICRIYLSARSEDYSKSATIAFRDSSSFSGGVSLSITAREDIVLRLKDKILDIIAGMRPWYNVMHRVNFFYVFFISWLILGIIRILSYISYLALEFKWVAVLLILSIPLLVLSFFSNKLRDFLFPPAAFTIGQGESRFKHASKVQKVIVSLGISLIAGLIIWISQIIAA